MLTYVDQHFLFNACIATHITYILHVSIKVCSVRLCDKILTADYVESHFAFSNKFKVKVNKNLTIAYYTSINLYYTFKQNNLN